MQGSYWIRRSKGQKNNTPGLIRVGYVCEEGCSAVRELMMIIHHRRDSVNDFRGDSAIEI